MFAIAKSAPEPGLTVIEVPEPKVGPGQVLLSVEHGSVCGTDLHIYNWDAWSAGRIHPPRVVGHEFCGTILEVGEGVTRVKKGDFVASESHIVDPNSPDYLHGFGHVDRTTRILGIDVDGGFAPYAVMPELNARPVPSAVPGEVACFLDALGNAVHTVMDGPVEGRSILITGMGPIGLFAVAACKALGASRIVATEVAPFRIEMAHKMGVDLVLNPAKDDVRAELARLEPSGFDATLEMSGHPSSLDLAIESTRMGGRISLLGVYPSTLKDVDFNRIIFKGLRLQGIVGRKMWETWDQMTWLLTEKQMDVTPIVTHRIDWREYDSAFQAMKKGEVGKVVLDFSSAR